MTVWLKTGKPMVLCLERMADEPEERFVRCTAKPGREKGLAIGLDGSIRWCDSGPVACELWVSRDQRLMAYCPGGPQATVLIRAGRALDLPQEKRVVVRDQDELLLAGARFRVHVHGITDEIHAPRVLRGLPRVAAAAAVTVALGSGATACGVSSEPGRSDGHASAARTLPDSGRMDGGPDATVSDTTYYVRDAQTPDDAYGEDVLEIRDFPPE